MVEELKVEGVFPVNTYFYIDDKSNSGFLIDPGAEAKRIYDFIIDKGWKIEKILITHGHMDHIGAVSYLQEKLDIPALIYPDEEEFLTNGYLNLSDNFGETLVVKEHTTFSNNEILHLHNDSKFYLKVLHTPGHTPGSVIFYSPDDNLAFIGDLLFEHGIGLTHFPGGNMEILKDSILNCLYKLPNDTVLYSSHAEPITLEKQKEKLAAAGLLPNV